MGGQSRGPLFLSSAACKIFINVRAGEKLPPREKQSSRPPITWRHEYRITLDGFDVVLNRGPIAPGMDLRS